MHLQKFKEKSIVTNYQWLNFKGTHVIHRENSLQIYQICKTFPVLVFEDVLVHQLLLQVYIFTLNEIPVSIALQFSTPMLRTKFYYQDLCKIDTAVNEFMHFIHRKSILYVNDKSYTREKFCAF